jgi:ribose transport system permease protein
VVLIAVGQTFVVISGGIDLSVGAIVGLSGVVAAWTMANVLGLDQSVKGPDAYGALLVGTLVSVGVGLFVGLVNAFLINKFKIVPFIATLATMGACLGFSVVCRLVRLTTSLLSRLWPRRATHSLGQC